MQITERGFLALIKVIVRFPKTVLLLFIICTGGLGWHAQYFEINASADTLLMKDDKQYLETQVMNRRFSPQEFLLIAYKPKKGSVFSATHLKNIGIISEKLRTVKRIESVRSILNVPLFWLYEGGLSSSLDPSQLTVESQHYDAIDLKDALGGDPIYEDLLINQSKTATAIQVLFKSPKKLDNLNNQMLDLQLKSQQGTLTAQQREKLSPLQREIEPLQRELDNVRAAEIQEIRGIVAPFTKDADIYMGGVHVLAYQLIEIIKNDLIVFGSAIAVMICLVLLVLFRRFRWVFIPVVCCSCSLLSTLGLFGLLNLKATVISSSFVALQLILTLAIVIHLIVQYRESGTQHPEWSQAQLVRETLWRKAGPCLYAGFINVVGFASLMYSTIRPVIDFGWMMSIAMFFAIGVSLILFPALMALFNKESWETKPALSHRIMLMFTHLSLNHPTLIVAVCLVVLVISSFGIYQLDVENSFLNYFRKSTQVHQELSFIDQNLGGTTPLDLIYTIPASEKKKDLVLTADTIMLLQRIKNALQQHQAVGKILSVVNFTEVAKEINHNKPLTEYELTTIYWTMEKALRDDLLGAFFSPSHGQVRFSIRIKDTTEGLRRSELLASLRQGMQQLGIPAQRYQLTNLFVLYENILQQLYQSQIKTLGVAFAVLSLTFLVVFRSFKLALIGIIPNLLSTFLVLGLMGWLGIPLDLMTIMIAAIAMGISVDDTIHYIHRYLEELQNTTAEETIARTHTSVGYAMLYTSLIVVLGFSLLAFSDFVPSILFGLLTALSMSMALIFNFTILPVLLRNRL